MGPGSSCRFAPHVVTEPGLVLYRFGAELYYANAGRFLRRFRTLLQPMPSSVEVVVVDAEAMTHMDYTAARILKRLKANLDEAGVELGFARVPWGSALRHGIATK